MDKAELQGRPVLSQHSLEGKGNVVASFVLLG